MLQLFKVSPFWLSLFLLVISWVKNVLKAIPMVYPLCQSIRMIKKNITVTVY